MLNLAKICQDQDQDQEILTLCEEKTVNDKIVQVIGTYKISLKLNNAIIGL